MFIEGSLESVSLRGSPLGVPGLPSNVLSCTRFAGGAACKKFHLVFLPVYKKFFGCGSDWEDDVGRCLSRRQSDSLLLTASVMRSTRSCSAVGDAWKIILSADLGSC